MALDYSGSHNLMRFPGFKLKALSLSYDDGLKTDKRLIDIMLKYGLKGTFNLNLGCISENTSDKLLTEKEAYELYTSSGMEVAVNGRHHVLVDKVDKSVAVNYLISDRGALEKLFGKVVKGLTYPFGALDENSANLFKICGFKYARTTNNTDNFNLPSNWLTLNPTTKNSSSNVLDLAKEFVELKECGYFWFNEPRFFCACGHSCDFLTEKDWDKFVEFAKIVSSAKDIWFASVGEVCDYVTAFERLEFSAEGAYIKNPTAIDVYVKYFNGENIVIPSGKTIKI